MNASDDEVFEDTFESLANTENSEIEVHTTAIMSPKPKSVTRSMTTYKTLCTNRIRDVNDAVTEYTGKTLALQQIERLEAIRDKLVERED